MTAMYSDPADDPTATYSICPRCGENTLRTDRPALNALSRTDNSTYICSPCGTSEALEDVARGLSRHSKESWAAPQAAGTTIPSL